MTLATTLGVVFIPVLFDVIERAIGWASGKAEAPDGVPSASGTGEPS